MIIVPTPEQIQSATFPKLREGIADCIKAAVPTARVYSRWPLKFSIGETVALLQSTEDSNRVHAWIMKVSRMEPVLTRVGGNYLEWDLNLSIWAFMGYEFGANDDDTTQNVFETEVRLISTVMYLNRLTLGMSDGSSLKSVGLLTFDDLDVMSFSSHGDFHVAQGTMNIRLSETYNL